MLFADLNDDIDKWLAAHPIVLGLLASAIAAILIGLGVSALRTGRAPTDGADLEGGQAKAMGVVWLVFGVAALLFGLYKISQGF